MAAETPTEAKAEAPKPKPKPIRVNADTELVFSGMAWEKMRRLCKLCPTELAGFLISDPEEPLRVIDFVIVEQESSTGECDFTEDGLCAHLEEYVTMKGLPSWRVMRIWAHTHPGNSAQPSGKDENYLNSYTQDLGTEWFVMFIMAKGGECYARLRMLTPGDGGADMPPIYTETQLKVSYEALVDDETEEDVVVSLPVGEWVKEMKAKVKKKEYKYEHKGYGGYTPPAIAGSTSGDKPVGKKVANPSSGGKDPMGYRVHRRNRDGHTYRCVFGGWNTSTGEWFNPVYVKEADWADRQKYRDADLGVEDSPLYNYQVDSFGRKYSCWPQPRKDTLVEPYEVRYKLEVTSPYYKSDTMVKDGKDAKPADGQHHQPMLPIPDGIAMSDEDYKQVDSFWSKNGWDYDEIRKRFNPPAQEMREFSNCTWRRKIEMILDWLAEEELEVEQYMLGVHGKASQEASGGSKSVPPDDDLDTRKMIEYMEGGD